MMSDLEAARDALRTVPGVVSCKIGLEANISPSDYPLIRLVPSRLTAGKPYGNRSADVLIYFGSSLTNAEGLEAVYAELFDLEAGILAVLKSLGARYLETITDEDRLDAYKLMTVRCELVGLTDLPQFVLPSALGAQSARVAGVAAHLTLHASTGALASPAAAVAGVAAHSV